MCTAQRLTTLTWVCCPAKEIHSVQTVWTEKIFDNEEGTTQCHCGKKTTNKTFSIISSKQPVYVTITVGCGQLAVNMQTDN